MDIKEIITKTRHKEELVMKKYAVGMTVGIVILIVVFDLVTRFLVSTPSSMIFYGVDVLNTVIKALRSYISISSIFTVIISLFCAFLYLYGQQLAYSVKVTEKNFPEIYAKALEYADKLSLDKIPEVYVVQSNGVVNAFSAWIMGRHYIQLNAELVDVAYMENHDFNSVYFVLAHEMGHIYFGHTDFLYQLSTYIGRTMPFFSQAFSRACEYSCDRVAQALTGNVGTNDAMMVIAAGRHLYKYVDMEDYLANINRKYKWYESIPIWIVNALSSHPITMYRLNALNDPYRRSGRLF